MKNILIAGVVLTLSAGAVCAQSGKTTSKTPDVVETSFVTADGARDLQQSIVIDAPVAALWKSYTDTAEFRRWNSPVSAIDLKVGGTFEASYDPKAMLGSPDNIKHRIITFLPERLIVFQNIQAPKALVGAEAFQKTVIVLQF